MSCVLQNQLPPSQPPSYPSFAASIGHAASTGSLSAGHDSHGIATHRASRDPRTATPLAASGQQVCYK